MHLTVAQIKSALYAIQCNQAFSVGHSELFRLASFSSTFWFYVIFWFNDNSRFHTLTLQRSHNAVALLKPIQHFGEFPIGNTRLNDALFQFFSIRLINQYLIAFKQG